MNDAFTNQTNDYLYTIENYEFTSESAKLDFSGKLPKSGYMKINSLGEITLILNDGKHYVSKTSSSDSIEKKLLTSTVLEV